MYHQVINHLPLKIPLAVILTLTVSLAGCHALGLLPVQIGRAEPRLLLLVVMYLGILSAIIYVQIRITVTSKKQLRVCQQVSEQDYEKEKAEETQRKLQQLSKDERYKEWLKSQKEQNKSYVYEKSDSEDEDQYDTQHKIATMTKLF